MSTIQKAFIGIFFLQVLILPFCQAGNGATSMPVARKENQSSAQADSRPGLKKESANTLEQFKLIAQEYNPTILEAKAQIEGEKAKALQAGLWPNPQFQYSGELIGERQAGLGEFQGGGIQQRIRLGGKLHYSRLKYKSRAEAAEEELRAQIMRVLNDLESDFYYVLAQQEKLKLQEELLRSARDRKLTRGEMFNTGEADRAQLNQANIDLAKQELSMTKAEYQLSFAWKKLAATAGIAEEKYRFLSGDPYIAAGSQPLNEELSLQHLLAETPVLKKAKKKLRSDELTVKREKRQQIPDLLIQGQSGYDQSNKSYATNVNVNLVDVPVWNRNQGTIKQAQADLARQKARIRLLELQLSQSFAEEFKIYKTEARYVETYKNTILPEARSRYQLCLDSYRNSRREWPDVLAAQKDYFNERLDYLDHCFALKKSEVQIKGFLLTGALKTPEAVTPPGHIDATAQPR